MGGEGGQCPVVNGEKIIFSPARMYQIDDADAPNQTMYVATEMLFDQFNELRVAFVLNRIIGNQKAVRSVDNVRFDRLPQLAGCEFFSSQKIAHSVVAHPFSPALVFRQMATGIV